FRYSGGNNVIWSDGTSQIDNFVLSAKLEMPLVDEKAPEGDRYLARMHITHFGIAKLSGQNIHYRSYASGLQATLYSGSLLDVHADGVDVDFGKTDSDPLLIKGGTAGFGKAEAVRGVATTGSGLAVSGVVNTQKLTAAFADDGTVTADL